MIIQGCVTIVLVLIYVLKPFSARCKGKEWKVLVEEKMFGNLPKMWFMGILLAVFSYWGAAGVLAPAIMITVFGPGKK